MATYSISPNSSAVNEGGSVTWTIITTGVANGTTLYWENVGTTTGADFTSGSNSGTILINNNFAILPITIAQDFTSEGGVETIIIRLYTDSLGAGGTLVATASTVNVADTSTEKTYNVVPSSTAVGEGSSVTWTITTTNVAAGTALFWINTGNTAAGDFLQATKSGVVYVDSLGIATLTLTLVGDLTLEGTENIIILVKTVSIVGDTVATSVPVIVNDTSTSIPGYATGSSIQPETIVVNDKLILSSNKTKNNNYVIERLIIGSDRKRFDGTKQEGTNEDIFFTTTRIKDHTVPVFRLNVKSEKIYDVDNLDNPRFSPNLINISSKYYVNSIKDYNSTTLKNFIDANNGVSLLKIDSTIDGSYDVRDYYDNNRRWTVPLSTTSVPWGPIKVQVDSPTFRYLDLTGGNFEIKKISNIDTQIYQQPTALQARSLPGGVSPAVEIKQTNTRFYLWKPRTQSLSNVLLNKSLFVATNSDAGIRGGSDITTNKGVLSSTAVVHLDRVNNNNFLETATATTTSWNTAQYPTIGAPSKLNTISYSSTILDTSSPPVVGFLSDWQTLIVTSESEGTDIEGTCWTQNIAAVSATVTTAAEPAKYILNGVGTKFLRDLKVGDKIINKDFVGYGFDQRFLKTGAVDNGAAGTGITQVRTITKIVNNTYAEVSTAWAPADSSTITAPLPPYKIFKNLTKQSRGITKYYVEGVLVATSNNTWQSWLIDKIGAMNSTAKDTTTAHAAPGFLAQAGVLDKSLNELEAYELHIRLKHLKDSTVDQSIYLIDPHFSEEKYMETVNLGSDNPANATEPDSTACLLMDGPLYVIAGNSNSGFLGGQSWRKLVPAGYMPHGKETYAYGDEQVLWNGSYWSYFNVINSRIFAVSYDDVTWPWQASWTNDFAGGKVISTYVKTNNYTTPFTNDIDLQSRQILSVAREPVKSEKIKTNVGSGIVENQSEFIYVNSTNSLEMRQLINVRSEKLVSFETSLTENWVY